MVDVNGSWDVDTAVQQLKAWEPYNVYWLEEPVPPHDIAGYRRVRERSGGTYIVGGEQHVGLNEFRALIGADAVDIVQPNAAITGGITDWLRIHRSEERRVGKECGSTWRFRWSPSHYKKTKIPRQTP